MSSTSPTAGPYMVKENRSEGLFTVEGPTFSSNTFHQRRLAESLCLELNAAHLAGQASREQQWIPVSEQPKDGSIVTAGHTAGWIEPDILFRQGKFYKRVNHLTGGDAGFKQKDWKKPDGNPAGPDEWPYGPELFPTHYQPLPQPPQNR